MNLRFLSAALLLPALASAHPSTLHRFVFAQQAAADRNSATGPAPLTIELTLDGETAPIAGLVRLYAVETAQPVNLATHLRRQMNWFSIGPGATVRVPAGDIRVEACRGLDTAIARATVRVPPEGARVRLALRRIYDPAARGLAGANTHLHLRYGSSGGTQIRTLAQAEEYLTTVGRSDALDFAFVSHLIRTGDNYVTNEFTPEHLARISDSRLRFVYGEEHRHEGGKFYDKGGPGELRYGHVLLLDLPRLVQPVSYGVIFDRDQPATDARPLRRGLAEGRALGATVVWCHGKQGLEDVPNWIDGVLDAQNIFDGGSEGTFDRVFYPYLNAGLRIPFSTGTDWGVYDFSRAYVPLAGERTGRAWLAQLVAGRAFITNGAFLEFEAAGLRAGDTLALDAPRTVRVRGRAVGREDFVQLELVHNGAVVATAARREAGGHFEADLDTSVELREPGWLALRIPPGQPYSDRTQYTGPGANLFGKALFAHTSPLYVTLAGRSIAQPEAIRTIIADLDQAIAAIVGKGAFKDDAERDALLAIYRNARTKISSRLVDGR